MCGISRSLTVLRGPFSVFVATVGSLTFHSALLPAQAVAQTPPAAVVKPKAKAPAAGRSKAPAAKPEVRADVLFEGYSKLIVAGEHSGYIIQRYEFDSAKKEFVYRHLLSAQDPSLQIRESLVARSTAGFEPIGYQFTEQKGSELKVIDMTFSRGKIMGTIRTGSGTALKTERINRDHPKGAFLAIFLPYVMLSGKEGLKAGVKYDYAAIAEEDASLQKGSAFIEKEEAIAGVRAFRTLIEFKGSKYTAFITGQGETIATRALANPVETQLVASADEALRGQSVNRPAIEAIFGPMPKGLENIIARNAKSPSAQQAQQAGTATSSPQPAPSGALAPSSSPQPPSTSTTAPTPAEKSN
jgi:hypothetical protein